jgi:hypothetical protein
MPLIGTSANQSLVAENRRRRRKPQPPRAAPRNADTGDPARGNTPQRRPAPVITRPLAQRPFQAQQQQTRQQTRAATRRLPVPVIAAPPVIHNPTPAQVHAAKAQIVASVRRNLGDSRGQERAARTAALYDQLSHDPRLRQARASVVHWQHEDAKLTGPQWRGTVRPGAPHKRVSGPGPLSFASVDLTALGRSAGRAAGRTAPGLQIPDAPGHFVGNAFKDVGTIATGPFVAGAVLASLGRDVVTGHPDVAAQRAGQYAKAVGQGIVEDATHPVRYFQQHPVLFALDVAGAASGVGRGAGALARARGIERASTIRPPLALGEDLAAGVHERRGSKDLIRREIQRRSDAKLEPLRDATGDVVTVAQGGKRVPVLKPRDTLMGGIRHPGVGEQGHLNNRRADMAASRANAGERSARDAEAADRHVRGVKGRAARDAVSMVAEGTITSAQHMRADLTAHAKRLRANLATHDAEVRAGQTPSIYIHEGEVEAARKRLATAEKVLASPKAMAQADRIVEEGVRHGRALVAHDTEAAKAGLFEGGVEQARRARLVVAATEHMGAQHGRDARLTAQAHAARKAQRALQARLNFGHAKTPAQRKALEAQIEIHRQARADAIARNTSRLRDAAGNPLEPGQVEEFLGSRGRDPESVAYLPANVTRRQFHKQFRPDQRGTLDTPGHVRTGAAHRKGATEASADLLKAAGVRHAVTLTKARNIDRLLSEHGQMHPAAAKAAAGQPLTRHEQSVVDAGGYFTGPEALEAVTRAAARGEDLRAVRAFPGRLDANTQKIIREDLQGPGAMDSLGQRLLNDRFLTADELKSGSARNVLLMNRPLIDRLESHLRPSSSVMKFAQITNRAFRYAVLPQPRWVVGNFFEPMFVRMPGVGSGINVFGLGVDVAAAVRQLRRMERSGDPRVVAEAKAIRAQQIGGLLFGNKGLTNRRTLEDFPALDRKIQKRYGQMVAKLPVTKQAAEITGMLLKGGGKALLAPLKLIFAINRAGEHGLQMAAFGKSVRREAQDFTRAWHKTLILSEKAMADVAKGLVNTATQQRFMAAQHELLGQYEGFSPALRAVIQGPAPFLPWALNAARFAFWTMPAHRSLQTALLTRLNEVVAKDWKQIHQGVPPGMGLAIPNGKGGWVDVARYTPYGLTGQIAQGDYRAITSQLLPQLSGVQAALEGKDPFGRDLSMSDHQPASGADKRRIALNSGLEAFVPYLSNIRRLQEHGETAFADSTAFKLPLIGGGPKSKPGTSHGMSAARRVLDPFRPTYLTAASASEVEPAPGPAVPRTPREAMLARRAARLHANFARSDRRQALLERRAARLSQHP